jgi:predicted ATPase
MNPPRLKSINIKGYRPFKDFSAQLGQLEVIVGANGSGKSSLFEFLSFLRDILHRDIPPEIVPGSEGQRIFHSPGPEMFSWEIVVGSPQSRSTKYQAQLMGSVGNPRVVLERVQILSSDGEEPVLVMEVKEHQGFMKDNVPKKPKSQPIARNPNQLALSFATNPSIRTPYELREYIRTWRFYDSFKIDRGKIRRPVVVEQNPIMHENAGNLSSVLHYVMTEHRSVFNELQQHLRSTIPGFSELTVKAYGAPGHVMAFWREEGIESELTLADLSDGILQLVCWAVLCIQPNPPSLICIDEPDQGVHPRTLPFLAGLLEKASDRTQVLVATHSIYLG